MDVKRTVAETICSGLLQNSIEESNALTTDGFFDTDDIQPDRDLFHYVDSGSTVAILFCKNEDEDRTLRAVLSCLSSADGCVLCYSLETLVNAHCLIERLSALNLLTLPIGVIAYDNNAKTVVLQSFRLADNLVTKRSETEWKSYWCWWRDSSQYEVATLLQLSVEYRNNPGDIYTDSVYPRFFDMMINGETQKWDGKPREKTYSLASYRAEKQNYKIPMCQLGLWSIATGQITEKGLRLLAVINSFGVSSSEYFDCLAKLVLIDGKHLLLIKDLKHFQKEHPEIIPETSGEFFVLFDDYMSGKKLLGTRKPTAVTTGAKRAYVRDEPKLWNKLGIVETGGSTRYYQPFKGITFNWERINEILMSDVMGADNE